MALAYESVSERARFSYAIEGLSAREELLLKSIIRLLDHRTKQAWLYEPLKPDLWIVDRESSMPSDAKLKNPMHHVCILASLQTSEVIAVDSSDVNAGKTFQTVVRLNAVNIEHVLNQMGDRFVAKFNAAAQAGRNTAFQVESYKLVRWPTRLIQGDNARSKIAALMLGKPLTVADIVDKSSCSISICEDFLAQLKAADLIEQLVTPVKHEESTIELKAATLGSNDKSFSIFARIRSRLAQPMWAKN